MNAKSAAVAGPVAPSVASLALLLFGSTSAIPGSPAFFQSATGFAQIVIEATGGGPLDILTFRWAGLV